MQFAALRDQGLTPYRVEVIRGRPHRHEDEVGKRQVGLFLLLRKLLAQGVEPRQLLATAVVGEQLDGLLLAEDRLVELAQLGVGLGQRVQRIRVLPAAEPHQRFDHVAEQIGAQTAGHAHPGRRL